MTSSCNNFILLKVTYRVTICSALL